jgi:hypothetical protein
LHRTVPIKTRFGRTVLNVNVAATLRIEQVDEVDACIYRTCEGCQFQCLRKILAVFKRFRIAYNSFEKGHSVVFKFTSPDDALMAYNALKWAGIRKAKLEFHA